MKLHIVTDYNSTASSLSTFQSRSYQQLDLSTHPVRFTKANRWRLLGQFELPQAMSAARA